MKKITKSLTLSSTFIYRDKSFMNNKKFNFFININYGFKKTLFNLFINIQ